MIPKPIRRSQVKRRRTGPPRRSSRCLNPAYLAFLRTLPCFICYADAYEFFAEYASVVAGPSSCAYGRQKSDTEAAHVGLSTSHRGGSQKHSDLESLPLCEVEHHQHGAFSIHVMGPAAFFEHHGADRDATIRMFNSLYEEHCR